MRLRVLLLVLFLPLLMNAQNINDGLVGYYKCDGNASDASGNGNNGSIIGGVTKTTDRWGNSCSALEFNGTDGYISIPDSRSLSSITDHITVTGWFRIIRTRDNVKWLTLVCKGDQAIETGDNPQFRVQFQTSAKSTISVNTATAKTPYSGAELPDDEWAFIALVYDRSDLNLYLNDSLIFTYPLSQSFISNHSPLEIGRDVPGHTEFFKGCFDDIRVYNRALSTKDLTTLYQDASGNIPKFDFKLQEKNNVEAVSDKGKCGATVRFSAPELKQDCGSASLMQIAGPSSGSIFDAGYTTVAFSASGNGRREVTSFEVYVADKEKPQITCPADITQAIPAGQTSMAVNYTEPTPTDNCPVVTSKLLKGLPSGSKFPVGVSEVTYEATDKAGNKAECTFKVNISAATPPTPEVKDVIPPTIICPADIKVACDPNSKTAKVAYTKPTALDNGKDVPVKLMQGFESGEAFPSGITKITYAAEDAAGNVAKCSFNVTVTCEEKWQLNCPADVTQETDKGKCGATVAYPLPVVSHSSFIGVVLTKGQRTGTFFNPGNTLNSYTATDNLGAKQECSLNVKVIDNEKPEISCPRDTVIWVEAGQAGAVHMYTEPSAKDNCSVAELKLTDGLKSGGTFPLGVNTITYTARDKYDNTSACSFKVTVSARAPKVVVDKTPPVITCPADVKATCDQTTKTAKVVYTKPTATDDGKDIPVTLSAGFGSGEAFPVGTTKVSYIAQDPAGNISKCSFNVIVTCEEKWNLSCSSDITQETDKGKCGATVVYSEPQVTGSSFVQVTLSKGQRPNTFFNAGTTLNSFTANDKTGAKQECSFNIKIVDNEKPEITCIRDTAIMIEAGETGVKYTYAEPTAKDNCGLVDIVLADGPKSGSIFPLGVNVITYTAKDKYQNTATCSFKVTVSARAPKVVVDNIPPVITCLPDLKVTCDGGSKTAKVVYDSPTAVDNGKPIPVKLSAGLQSGEAFPIGVSTITFMAQDAAGNISKCSFRITVTCEEKWSLTCSNDITKESDKGKCGTTVTYSPPQVTGSGAVEIVLTKGQKANSFFKAGNTVNSYTATDKAGAKQECSFNIKVLDSEKPTINCPHDTVILIAGDETGAKFVYVEPAANDNCTISEIKLIDGPKSGSIFPIGANAVTYTAKDASGNSATCSFYVTVKKKEAAAPPVAKKIEKTTYGDTIRIQSSEVIADCAITLFVADDGVEDGDTVSIFFNGVEVIKRQGLKINKAGAYTDIIGLPLDLVPGQTNTIIAKAWNVGSIPPNTMEIKVFAGNVLSDLPAVKTMKTLLRKKFQCYPGLTDGMTLNCR
ncbi:MAG: secreted protein containing hyalin domain [Bacteroidetes bacterium]|nr:secreted protein containing hyalin domain [Bacteroidota bacterium]